MLDIILYGDTYFGCCFNICMIFHSIFWRLVVWHLLTWPILSFYEQTATLCYQFAFSHTRPYCPRRSFLTKGTVQILIYICIVFILIFITLFFCLYPTSTLWHLSPFQSSPNESHVSQSSSGVRLTAAETSSCSNHVTVGVCGGSIPFQELQLNSAAIKKSHFFWLQQIVTEVSVSSLARWGLDPVEREWLRGAQRSGRAGQEVRSHTATKIWTLLLLLKLQFLQWRLVHFCQANSW